MKSIYIALLVVFSYALPGYAEDQLKSAPVPPQGSKVIPKVEPLSCPQCGVWQVDEVGMLVIDDKRIIIPGCGVFDYEVEKFSSMPRPQQEDRNTYNVSMLLKQRKTSFLCDNGDEKDWYLEADVSGHFREGGTATFKLRKSRSAKPTLWFSGWNMDREDPCEAGSSGGSAVCLKIEYSHVYNALSHQLEGAYGILINTQKKQLPDFNAARFAASVHKFCTESESESGSFSWPAYYALSCQCKIMEKKYDEFVTWRSCMEKHKDKLSLCKFPDESFARDIEHAADEE